MVISACLLKSPADSLSLKTTSASDRPPSDGFKSARASDCKFRTSLPKADWTTLVQSKQSIQLMQKTPFCLDIMTVSDAQKNLQGGRCDKSHFYLYFSPFFPYIFDTITTKRWQVANKETLLQHSQALRPIRLSWSTRPSRLTWHYQDYDVNYDNRAGFLLAIQYASIYSAAFCGQSY